jgi:hypothetical protein
MPSFGTVFYSVLVALFAAALSTMGFFTQKWSPKGKVSA